MSRRRRLTRLLQRRTPRRLITVPATLLIALVAILAFPVVLIGALLFDLIDRGSDLRRTRVTILLTGSLVVESIGILTWIITFPILGFGLWRNARWTWRMHGVITGAYTMTLLRLIAVCIGTTIEWRDRPIGGGPVVMLARHTSFFDALIPATVLARRNGLIPHHILTAGLRYAPCIDLVGHRFPNRFIDRSPGAGSAELRHIENIGRWVAADSAALIFPEGTFRTERRFERAMRRVNRGDPDRAAQAAKWRHVLPPRPNGSHALLDGAADADVVVCVNTGFEPYGTLKEMFQLPRSPRPIVIETWRVARSEIPDQIEAFTEWLYDQFDRIEAWVDDERHRAGLT